MKFKSFVFGGFLFLGVFSYENTTYGMQRIRQGLIKNGGLTVCAALLTGAASYLAGNNPPWATMVCGPACGCTHAFISGNGWNDCGNSLKYSAIIGGLAGLSTPLAIFILNKFAHSEIKANLIRHINAIGKAGHDTAALVGQTVQHVGNAAYESKAGEIVRDRLQQLENYRHGRSLTLQDIDTAFRQHLLNDLATENAETDMTIDNLNVPRAIQSAIVENLAKNSPYARSADGAIPAHCGVIDPEILNQLTLDEFELLEAFTVVLQDRARNPENARMCIHPTPKQLKTWQNLKELLDDESKDLLSDLISYR